jgi:hypothetical protein
MPTFSTNILSRLACGIYRGLLYAYPPEFRTRYGPEMNQVFRDQLRDTLAKQGIGGFVRFSMRTAWDLLASVMRERFTLKSLAGIVYLAAAIGFSISAEYVDRHNVTEVYPTLTVAIVGSFLLGLARPSRPWRWAMMIGIGVPFFGPLAVLPSRLASPGRWAMLAVMLIPGLIGAYSGSALRRPLGTPRSEPAT